MSSRIFQSVVLQMKDSTERAIGVIDSEGTVVACNELSCIGEHWPGAVEAVNRGEGDAVRFDGRTFKALAGWGAQFDYAAFVKGEDSEAQMLCAMATVALNGAKTYYEEKHDKATFVKNIISDNILLGDIYVRAKELHFVSEAPRAVFLIRQVETSDPALIDVVHTLFPDKQVDFVLSISETDVALIKQLSEGAEPRELYKIAKQIEELTGFETRVCVPGHMQRGGSPSPYDRVLATQFGSYAAKMVEDENYGITIAMKNNHVGENKLKDVAGKSRLVPESNGMLEVARRMGISMG